MPRAAGSIDTGPIDTGPTDQPEGAGSTHPLAASVGAIDRAADWMSFRLLDATNTEWIGCEQALSDPPYFTRWRAAVARRLAQQYANVPEQTTAGYVLQWYLGIPTHFGAMLFHSARRVPSLQPRQLAFRLDPERVSGVALRPGRFWCLPEDPDAGHSDAVQVPDEAALAAVLRHEVVAHATRFLNIYSPLVRFGRHTLWAAVTDMLDAALLLGGRAFGCPQAGAADARLVLAHREEPFTSASTTCVVTDERGRTHWTRRRGSCCFYYALPGIEQPCATCPRVTDAARARILSTLDLN